MIVAAHQPAYLPWLGYLDKMAKADVFVVMDDLQYEAQNFQNRNRIKLNNGAAWLTVPLEKGPQSQRICDKSISNAGSPKEHWQRRSWETLK
ncbi:MAG: WbqC family protein, partial [Deltaproteobacteria bacterium]|nr:WbqC family protein [Deltaproteobacteria bacterium]